ncbi:MAG: hypothetical protein C0404_12600 [Verrucomicrobia bacterium]|nr:hypothetical protein [Verrucomicrobiota bacterium]
MSYRDIDQAIVNDIRVFDFFAQKVWPHIRNFFRGVVARRCKQCVISSKVPGVTLNSDGVCNLCEQHAKRVQNGEEKGWHDKYLAYQRRELDTLLKTYQGKGRGRYDAVVLFSGGKDSVYMLSRIRKEYPGLRLLLMTWNNGFYSKVALDKTKEIAAKLDLDHIVYKPVSSVYKTLYRYTLQHVGKKGSYQTVDRLDGSLNQFLGMDFAYEWDIPLVLAGVDFAQELIMQFHAHFEMPYEDMCSRTLTDRMERRSGFKIAEIFCPESQALFWDGTNKDRTRIPRYILPLVAWRPDKTEVQGELSLSGLLPKRDSSPVLTNNQVLSVMTALDIQEIGYCSFEPEFSKMIRFRENDPVYWLNTFEFVEFLVRKRLFVTRICGKVLQKLDLTAEQLGLKTRWSWRERLGVAGQTLPVIRETRHA